MAEIKSALELALEKAERYGRASKEEMAQDQYRDRGRHLGVNYLKEGGDLASELRSLPPEGVAAAREALKEVFLRNITLPRNGETDDREQRALQGLVLAAANQKDMSRLKADMEQLLQQYRQLRNNAFQQLKARFSAGLGNMQRALEAQMRTKMKVEAEHLPQFQEEWRRFQGQLAEQFEPVLENLKAKMRLA